MKAVRMILAIGAATLALSMIAQDKIVIVPGDQCSACKWMMPFHDAYTKRGITDQQVLLSNGMAWFFFGTSAEDSKWLQKQFAEFNSAMRKPDVKFCENCAPIARYAMNPKTTQQVVATKTGCIMMMTSTDSEANEAIHAHLKKMMEMDQKMKSGEGMQGGRADAVFLGKGDGMTTCPVTGAKVGATTAEINGKTVHFCCGGCVARVKAHPEQYLR